jgi:hypothetical protein
MPLRAATPFVDWSTIRQVIGAVVDNEMMVAEHNVPEDAVIPRHDREKFKVDQTIPSYITIWVGRHNSPDWQTTFHRHTATMSMSPNPPPAALAGRKNVETMTFGFGNFFVFAMVSDPEGGVDLNHFIAVRHLARLSPPTGQPLLWGAFVLRGFEPANVARSLDRVIQRPRSLWMPLPRNP